MKTQTTKQQNILEVKSSEKKSKKTFALAVLTLIAVLVFNPMNIQAQTNQGISVSGTVTDANGPLLGVNIILKNSEIGIHSDSKGQYTFPRPLQANDVLVFTYLGYDTKELTIEDDMTSYDVTMEIDSIVMRGALEVNTPYKSKRTK